MTQPGAVAVGNLQQAHVGALQNPVLSQPGVVTNTIYCLGTAQAGIATPQQYTSQYTSQQLGVAMQVSHVTRDSDYITNEIKYKSVDQSLVMFGRNAPVNMINNFFLKNLCGHKRHFVYVIAAKVSELVPWRTFMCNNCFYCCSKLLYNRHFLR